MIGDLEARYDDVVRLGEGAEGGALAATERATGRRVVLKRVLAEHVRAVRYAFGVLRRAGSPHLPAPRALWTAADGAGWMVTDWVAGAPLPRARAAGVAEALAEARAVAHALAAIHGAGTHHGDVAPGNVLVTPTGGVVLVDLGQLGRHGIGTPGFIAPEVLAGGGGPAADRFSLGCVLCLRLLGEVPWARPEALLQVRGSAAVADRIAALGGDALDPPVRALLLRLLQPRPEDRVADPVHLVAQLTRLHAAAEAGIDLRRGDPWWCPARWPYRGTALDEALARLRGPEAAPLLAVAGPQGVGRGRVVEELVQSLQADPDGPAARACEPERLGAVLGHAGRPWLQAWRDTGAASEPTPVTDVVGVLQPPPWPEALASEDADPLRATVLREVSAHAGVRLVLPVSESLGRALADRGVPVVEVRPWSRAEVAAALDGVVDASDREAWAARLHAATGGWPARVIRAARACAAAQLDEPSAPAVTDALVRAAESTSLSLDVGTARAVMLAAWGTGTVDALPAHLHDGERPWVTAEAAARRRLGDELGGLARDVAAVAQRHDEALSLALAIDADLPEAIEARLDPRRPDATVSRSEPRALTRWLAEGGAARLRPATIAALMRGRLARGEVDAALVLAPHASTPAGALAHARALHRRGRLDDALARLDRATDADAATDADPDPAVTWAARGLRWRVWIDQGHADRALAAARAALPEAPESGPGSATAHLWAAMAALATGELAQASTWLDAAVRAATASAQASPRAAGREPSTPPQTPAEARTEAAGILARAHQLRGNLAQARGDLRAAQRCYADAARAFEVAGETVGGLLLHGSLAGLAVLAYDFADGLEHGRTAVGGLVAQGQPAATLDAGLNLVQLLVRVGAEGQAHALGRMLDELHAGATGLPRARLLRVRAELASARLLPGASGRGTVPPGAQAAAESSFATAAQRLADAGAPAEAAEAWRRAAALARVQGQRGRAAAHLHQARLAAGPQPDADTEAEVELEAALQDLAHDDPASLQRALQRLAALGRPDDWCRRGRVDLAWAYGRALLVALRRRLPSSHPARRRAASRWLSTLELIMKQTGPLDRSAVRGALLVDGGDPQPLRELLAELDDASSPTPVPASSSASPTAPSAAAAAPSAEHVRFEQLLKIYRRLAREDRLEVLLQQVVDAMMELTDAERGAVVVLPAEHTERLEVTRELAEGSEGVRFSRSVIERVLAEGEPVLSVDAAADDRFDGSRSISHLNLRSVLAVPLRFRGEQLGAAYVDHRLRRGNFDEHDLARMEEFAELAALAVAHARALAELRAQTEAMTAQQAELSRLLEARDIEVLGLREEVRSAQSGAGLALDDGPRGYRGIIGNTPIMQRIFTLIDRVADADVPVVIHGESGTGKELVARALHEAGPRRDGPFIAENCGAIPETLLESVLFGHVKGAFTGAGSAKAGLFEAANGGTIFLDEVGETSPAMQTKLLRVLQEGELRRVGDNQARPIDVRVIAASNRDLEAMVERGEFRRDLYYRINVVKIDLPPLRERIDDLPALIEHFATRHAPGRSLRVTPAAMRRLAQHPWPGNVRELENEVLRWIALTEGEVELEDLSMATRPTVAGGADSLEATLADDADLQIRPRIERLERRLIDAAMDRTSGNQTKAAALLGLSRYGLQKKLRRLAEQDDDQGQGA